MRREVTQVIVEPSSQQLFVGQRFVFNARVTADSGVSTAVTWSTSNASVATVNPTTGEVTAVAPGSALITATSTATTGPVRTGSASVIVAGRGVTGITATPGALTLTAGTTQTLGVNVDAAAGVARTVTCTSSTPAVATTATAANGTTCTVTAVTPGNATITIASTVDPTITAAVGITVTPAAPNVTGISVNPSNVRLAPNETQNVTVQVTTANNTIARTFTATSSNTNVVRATVTTTGTGAAATSTLALTGVAPGTATVNVCSTVETNVCAQIGVTVTAIVPATVTIKSITQFATNLPVNVSNVAGQIDVTVTVEANDELVQRVEVLIDGQVCSAQDIATAVAARMLQASASANVAVADIVLSCRTDNFDPATGRPDWFNGTHVISARARTVPRFTVAGTTPTPTFRASNTQTINLNNSDGFYMQPSAGTVSGTLGNYANTPNVPGGVAQATDPRGLVWNQGDISFTTVFVNYSGASITNVQARFGFGPQQGSNAFANSILGFLVVPANGAVFPAINEGTLLFACPTGVTAVGNICQLSTPSANGPFTFTVQIPQGDDCTGIGGLGTATALPLTAGVPVGGGAPTAGPSDIFGFAQVGDGPQAPCGYYTPFTQIGNTIPTVNPEFPVITATNSVGQTVQYNTGPIINSYASLLNRADMSARIAAFGPLGPGGNQLAPNTAFPACTGRTGTGNTGCVQILGKRIDNANPADVVLGLAGGAAVAQAGNATYFGPNPDYAITGDMGRNAWVGNTTSFAEFMGPFADLGVGMTVGFVGNPVETRDVVYKVAVSGATGSLGPSQTTGCFAINAQATAATNCVALTGAAAGTLLAGRTSGTNGETILNTELIGQADPRDKLGNTNQLLLQTTTSSVFTGAATIGGKRSALPALGGAATTPTTNRFGLDLTGPDLVNVGYDASFPTTPAGNGTHSVGTRQVFETAAHPEAPGFRYFVWDVRDNLSGFEGNGIWVIDRFSGTVLNGLSGQFTRHSIADVSQTTPRCIAPSRVFTSTASQSTISSPLGVNNLPALADATSPTTSNARNPREAGCSFGLIELTGGAIVLNNFQRSEPVNITGWAAAAGGAPSTTQNNPTFGTTAGAVAAVIGARANDFTYVPQAYIQAPRGATVTFGGANIFATPGRNNASPIAAGYYGSVARLCDSARNCTDDPTLLGNGASALQAVPGFPGFTFPRTLQHTRIAYGPNENSRVVAVDPGLAQQNVCAPGAANPCTVGVVQQGSPVVPVTANTATHTFQMTISSQDDLEIIDARATIGYANGFNINYPDRGIRGDPNLLASPTNNVDGIAPGFDLPGASGDYDRAVRAGPYVPLFLVSGADPGTSPLAEAPTNTVVGGQTLIGIRFNLFLTTPAQTLVQVGAGVNGQHSFIRGIQQVPAGQPVAGSTATAPAAGTTPSMATGYSVETSDVWGHRSNTVADVVLSQTVGTCATFGNATGAPASGTNAIGFFGRTATTPAGAVEVQGEAGNRTFANPFVRVDFLQLIAGVWVVRGSVTQFATAENETNTRYYVYGAPAGLPEGTYRAIGIRTDGCGLMTQNLNVFPTNATPTP